MLTFPTLAEQALANWRATTGTKPLAPFAATLGATRDDEGTVIIWVFPDDTSIRINGRGRNWNAEAMLP